MGHGKAVVLAANASVKLNEAADSVCLFLPVTAGFITITSSNGTVLLNLFPVSAGVWVPLDFFVGTNGQATIVLTGGASGTLVVN